MEKYKRSERLVIITQKLLEYPGTVIPLNYFADIFQVAKSTISEDLAILKNTFNQFASGKVDTITGTAGGVKYITYKSPNEINATLNKLCTQLSQPERIITGGFLYMTDLIFDPDRVADLGQIFATKFTDLNPDYIITIETKGIPLALMTARALNRPLIIIRDQSKVTEGSSVSINYVSSTTKNIRTMALSRRALPSGAKVVFIDDFMRAGSTSKGMLDLMAEFRATVLGIGVLVATKDPKEKLVSDYVALLQLETVDEEKREVIIKPII